MKILNNSNETCMSLNMCKSLEIDWNVQTLDLLLLRSPRLGTFWELNKFLWYFNQIVNMPSTRLQKRSCSTPSTNSWFIRFNRTVSNISQESKIKYDSMQKWASLQHITVLAFSELSLMINRYLYCLLITKNDFNSKTSGDLVRLMKTNN